MFNSSAGLGRVVGRAGAVASAVALLGLGMAAPAQANDALPIDSPAGTLKPAGDIPPSFGDPLTTQVCGVSGTGLTGPGILECNQRFEQGAIFWNELSGMHRVHGGIYEAWVAESALPQRGTIPVSQLQPTTDEIPVANGVQQHFSYVDQGRVIYFWSSETGAQFVDVDTAAGQYFVTMGGPEAFGFPVGQVGVNADGTSVLKTSQGTVTAGFDSVGQPTGSFTQG